MTTPLPAVNQTVPIAGIGICHGAGCLRTLLGSCIGVVLYDRRLKLAGLAHIMMPDSQGRDAASGKYADMAIPETIRRMQACVSLQRMSLSAKIAGGANMFARIANGNISIGDQNVAAVEEVLKKLNIPILAKRVGGTAGRRMSVDVMTGVVQIHLVGQEPEVI